MSTIFRDINTYLIGCCIIWKGWESVTWHILSYYFSFHDILLLYFFRFILLVIEKYCRRHNGPIKAGSRVRKTPSARQQCWPESFCESGKFLQKAHYWLKNFRIFWKMSGYYTKYPDNMQSVLMNWKVPGQSKKCPVNLENVSG